MDLIAFGTVFLEIVFGQVPALPGPGEEIYADEFAVSCGGGAVTVASAATRLGARAGVATLLGDDLGSRVVEEHCRHLGVDLSPSRYVPGRVAGITVVLNFDADRAFVSYVPPRPPDERPERERWLDVLRQYRPAWCYLHAGTRTCGLLREVRSLGVRIALDLALNDIADDRDAVLRCVREADIFLPNTDELMRLARAGTLDAAIDAASSWCPCVVVTRGPEGATVIDRGARTDVTEGLRQVQVRDRTGAGDAFAGALIGALCNGASITEAAAAGNEAGSETVGILGAVGEVEVEGLSAAAPLLASTLGRTMAGQPAVPPHAASQTAAAAGAAHERRGRKAGMKLAVLGGGGVRIPAFIRGVLSDGAGFDEISLFEPDEFRRNTTGRLAVELAAALGQPDTVKLTAEAEEAFSGADFVFSAIRVGGDAARVVDEEVALRRGIVGQETTGPGGCAMALRTIPVLLSYCEILSRCAPGAVLINFTNPAGLITQAISLHTSVPVVGVCDTPSSTLERLARFLGADQGKIAFSYGGLNHLGWITSFAVDGQELIGTLLDRYEELQRFDHVFAAFDPALVRRLGAIPTEYVYYFYEPTRYVAAVAHAGASRGADVLRLNSELLTAIMVAFDTGGVDDAWSAYSRLMGIRRDTYMRTDTEGENQQARARARREADGPEELGSGRPGGYAGVALQVIDGLTGRSPGEVIVNTRNGASLSFLDPDDVVEVPALIHGGGVSPLAVGELPRSARGLITQTKQYERELVDAAVSGDAGLAALALALHPLVPGVTVAREMMSEYRELHGPHLAYLH